MSEKSKGPWINAEAKRPDDTDALRNRISSYEEFASRDILEILEHWMDRFEVNPKLFLDMGCGTGKQTHAILKKFPDAQVLALDLSEEAVATLQNIPRVQCKRIDMNDWDALKDFLDPYKGKIDGLISFYAIYYAKNHAHLLHRLMPYLSLEGKVLVTGYSRYNNWELVDMTRRFSGISPETDDFLDPLKVKDDFEDCYVDWQYFHNPLRFPSIETFTRYYCNYGLYDPKIEDNILKEVGQIITDLGQFELSKIALSIEMTKIPPSKCIRKLPEPLESHFFSPLHYRELLQQLIDEKYQIVSIEKLDKVKELNADVKILILRHDVDISVELALEMAKIENEFGIQSSYYILMSGEFFNPLAKRNRDSIRNIEKLGHEIGLHFDSPQEFGSDQKVLEALLGHPIKSYSQHNPTIMGFKNIDTKNLKNAYDTDIQETMGFRYVSDSGMRWREPDIHSLLNLGEKRIYLLTHPESWFSQGADLVENLRRAENSEITQIRNTYGNYIAGNVDYLRKRLETD